MVWLALALLLTITCAAGSVMAANHDADVAAIRACVDQFVEAANTGDIALAGEVWLQSDEVSLIHPNGHHGGWDAIQRDYYTNQLLRTLNRKLAAHDVVVHLFGDAAVVEFDWVFDATSGNGSAIHFTGRESQIYHRMGDRRWRLIHVHYSAAPIH